MPWESLHCTSHLCSLVWFTICHNSLQSHSENITDRERNKKKKWNFPADVRCSQQNKGLLYVCTVQDMESGKRAPCSALMLNILVHSYSIRGLMLYCAKYNSLQNGFIIHLCSPCKWVVQYNLILWYELTAWSPLRIW
jgi:hypothetical protein